MYVCRVVYKTILAFEKLNYFEYYALNRQLSVFRCCSMAGNDLLTWQRGSVSWKSAAVQLSGRQSMGSSSCWLRSSWPQDDRSTTCTACVRVRTQQLLRK